MELTLKINENISAKQAAKLTELGSMIEERTLIEQTVRMQSGFILLRQRREIRRLFIIWAECI